ncbi:MAG: DUF4317 domain-containing protein [Christensenellales bacterium]|nr:DUF4317 domain-containing protein [Christensenellales bacterium]
MNKFDFAEIRRRFQPDKNSISCIRGCYVNEKREIVSTFNRPLMSLPQEESEKYLAIFRRVLSGLPGKNLVEMVFRPDQVMESVEHGLLTSLRNTALKVDEGVQSLCQRIIDSLDLEGNYLILLTYDAYDVPRMAHDSVQDEDASENIFDYILCAICPVKLTKPALSYFAEDNNFHEREQNWIVATPELGFMFPAFEDRAANIYSAVYFSRDTETKRDGLIAALFNTESPMPAGEQKKVFQSILEDSIGEDLHYDVLQTIHAQLCDRLEEHKAERASEPLCISRREVSAILSDCDVPKDRMEAFETQYDQEFGFGTNLNVQNIVNERKFELRTPEVVINVAPGCSDLVETRVIDGFRYILIRAEEGVEVNGMNIRIPER